MLQKLRDRVNGVLARVLFSLLAVSFVLWGISSYLESPSSGGRILAKVGSQTVHQAQLDQQWKLAQQQGQVPLSLGASAQAMFKQSLLEELIAQALKINVALDLGLVATQRQVLKSIAENPLFMQNGVFSRQNYLNVLQANNLTESGLSDVVKHQILLHQLMGGVLSTNFIVPQELNLAYILFNQTRDIRYITLSKQLFLPHKVPAKAVIDAYYQQHKAQYKLPAQVKVSYVHLTPQHVRQSVQLTEQQLKDYYQANRPSMRKAERWKVLQIKLTADSTDAAAKAKTLEKIVQLRAKILEGRAKFDILAKQYDASAAPSWVTAQDVSVAAITALKGLSKGEMSAPIALADGYVMYKLIAHQAALQQTFAQVRQQIRQQLVNARVSEELQQDSDQLANLSYTNPDSLAPVSKALHLQIQHTGWLTKNQSLSAKLSDPKIMAAAFSDDVLQAKNNSKPISLADGSLLVLRVDSHQPSRIPALSAVHTQVLKAVRMQQAQVAAQQYAQQIKRQLTQGHSVQSLLQAHNLQWRQLSRLSEQSTAVPAEVLHVAFALAPSRGSAADSINPIAIQQTAAGDYLLLQLQGIHHPDDASLRAKLKQQTAARLLKAMAKLEQDSYMRAITLHSKVKIYH